MSSPTGTVHALLGQASFRWYLLMVVASLVAFELQTVAVGWQLFEATGDALSLGLTGLAGAIPFLSTALVAGHVADAHDRRRVCLGALAVLIACSATLATLTWTGLALRQHWTIYAVIVAAGFARSFLFPARGALLAELVPRPWMETAVRLRSTVFQLGAVMARSASGFVYAYGASLGLGAGFSYALAGLLLGVAGTALLSMRLAPRAPTAHPEPVLTSLAGGVRYVAGSPILHGAMLLDLLGVLFGDAIVLLPVFVNQIWHGGPQSLGLLRAAPAAGAVVMAFILMRRPPLRHAGPTLLVAVGGFGLAMIGFAVSPWLPLAAACLALSGALDFISVTIRGSLLQILTPPHLLGRVTSVQQMFIWSSNEIGAFESGVAARVLGLVPSVVAGGAVTVGVTVVTAWRNRSLRGLGRITPEAKPVAAAPPLPRHAPNARPQAIAEAGTA